MLWPRSRLKCDIPGPLHSLCIVGRDVGSTEALGRPMMPLENTEKKGFAHGIVAEMTLTWQASSVMTCNLTIEIAGLEVKMLECIG
jgi:hypothetical protein